MCASSLLFQHQPALPLPAPAATSLAAHPAPLPAHPRSAEGERGLRRAPLKAPFWGSPPAAGSSPVPGPRPPAPEAALRAGAAAGGGSRGLLRSLRAAAGACAAFARGAHGRRRRRRGSGVRRGAEGSGKERRGRERSGGEGREERRRAQPLGPAPAAAPGGALRVCMALRGWRWLRDGPARAARPARHGCQRGAVQQSHPPAEPAAPRGDHQTWLVAGDPALHGLPQSPGVSGRSVSF